MNGPGNDSTKSGVLEAGFRSCMMAMGMYPRLRSGFFNSSDMRTIERTSRFKRNAIESDVGLGACPGVEIYKPV